ncbi:reverse transcriptase domain-containing protein, partial [Tanacetum coccineum]
MEKLVLASVHASKRLRRYFQAHPIIVITDQPIKNILLNPEVVGRMQKWSIQLGEFSIHYRPRVSVKGQVLADFIVERPEEEGQDDSTKEEEPFRYCGPCSRTGHPVLTDAEQDFAHLSKQVLVEELKEKSVNESELLAVVEEEGDSWMTPIHKYLTDETLPEERKKARAIKLAMDYFTKWIEAKPVATIIGNQVKKFVWENIVCRFGLPGEIISDNGKQFRDKPFRDWCEKLCIQQHFTSVKHPQTNGVVEKANRSLGEGVKARLGKDNKNWLEEISHVLWAHRTMIKSSNGDTPFSLTYGTEAVIPAEIGMPTLRTAEVDVVENDEALEINLELLEEKREQAAIREEKSKRQMEKYYNTKVRNTSFKP